VRRSSGEPGVGGKTGHRTNRLGKLLMQIAEDLRWLRTRGSLAIRTRFSPPEGPEGEGVSQGLDSWNAVLPFLTCGAAQSIGGAGFKKD
jgi:hypothetical protein